MTLISKVLTHAISNLSGKNTGHDQEATQMIKTEPQKRKRGREREMERARERFRCMAEFQFK